MLKSSAASRPSSAASNRFFAAFERRLVPAMRVLGDLPFVAAVREALPWSFIALAAALIAVFFFQPAATGARPAPWDLRIALALLPAFGVMAAPWWCCLALSLAARAIAPLAAAPARRVGGFALALPRPFGPDPVDYLRELGRERALSRDLGLRRRGAWIVLLRRFIHGPAGAWAAALLALATFGALRAGARFARGRYRRGFASRSPALATRISRLSSIVFIETLLWTAGVHGPAVLAAIVTPVYLTMQMQNTQAFARHHPLPYIVVVSLFLFVFPGGAGATLPLAAMLAISRVPRLRKIGRVYAAARTFQHQRAADFRRAGRLQSVSRESVRRRAAGFRDHDVRGSRIRLVCARRLLRAVFRSDVRIDVRRNAGRPRARPGRVNIALAAAIYYPFVRAYERHVEPAQTRGERCVIELLCERFGIGGARSRRRAARTSAHAPIAYPAQARSQRQRLARVPGRGYRRERPCRFDRLRLRRRRARAATNRCSRASSAPNACSRDSRSSAERTPSSRRSPRAYRRVRRCCRSPAGPTIRCATRSAMRRTRWSRKALPIARSSLRRDGGIDLDALDAAAGDRPASRPSSCNARAATRRGRSLSIDACARASSHPSRRARRRDSRRQLLRRTGRSARADARRRRLDHGFADQEPRRIDSRRRAATSPAAPIWWNASPRGYTRRASAAALGPSLGFGRSFVQGLVSCTAGRRTMSARPRFRGGAFRELGYRVDPQPGDARTDIVQAIRLGFAELLAALRGGFASGVAD